MYRAVFILVVSLMAELLGAAPSPRVVAYDASSGLGSMPVGAAVRAPDGLMWFATRHGLQCFDGYAFHRIGIRPGDGTPIPTDHIRDILLSPDSTEIFCRTDAGIFSFSLSDFTFSSLSPHRRALIAPSMGKTWHGFTDTQGIHWSADLSRLYKTFTPHHPASVIEATAGHCVRALLADTLGSLWVGTRVPTQAGLLSADGNVARTVALPHDPYCIFRTSGGSLWAGCKPAALVRLDDGTVLVPPAPVYDIAEDAAGRLWLATFGGGVVCMPRPADVVPQLLRVGGDHAAVRRVLVTQEGLLVAATSSGLLVGNVALPDVRAVRLRTIRRDSSRASSLCSDALMSLALDSRGRLFVASESSGIDMIAADSLMAPEPVFTHFSTANSSLVSDMCRALALVSDTMLVVVCHDNVMAFNPVSDTTVNYARTFWGDSVAFTEATPVVLPDGSWAVGAEQGVFIATPHNLYTRGYMPPVVFTTLQANGDTGEFCLPPLSSVTIPPHRRNITVGFAAIDHTDNSMILYRTGLDDSPWTAASTSRGITLFNLAPGIHTLRVQSTDRYGRWVPNVATLHIEVEPRWHETLWAHLLMGVLLLAAAASAVGLTLYVRRLRRQRRELLEKYVALLGSDTSQTSPSPHPDTIGPVSKPEDAAFLGRVRRYIDGNIGNPEANIDAMAAEAAASRSTLNRRLRSLLGVSAARLLIEARLQLAARLLVDSPAMPLSEIAIRCGYTDLRYFRRAFRKRHGLTPEHYRQSASR